MDRKQVIEIFLPDDDDTAEFDLKGFIGKECESDTEWVMGPFGKVLEQKKKKSYFSPTPEQPHTAKGKVKIKA